MNNFAFLTDFFVKMRSRNLLGDAQKVKIVQCASDQAGWQAEVASRAASLDSSGSLCPTQIAFKLATLSSVLSSGSTSSIQGIKS